MSSTQLYSPIIKGKLNDLKAVDRLSSDARSRIKPLIEAMPLPAKNKGLDEHLEKFVKYIVKYANVEEFFVDFYNLPPHLKTQDGINATLAGYHLLEEQGAPVTPTYGFERDDDLQRDEKLWESLSAVVTIFGRGFCFRIDIDDLDDQAENTMNQVIARSSQLGLKPKDVDLFIDLRDLAGCDLVELKGLVLDFLQLIPQGQEYRSIILAGSSALKYVTDIPDEESMDVIQHELRIWGEIQLDVPESLTLVYGDYGVIHPDFSEAGNSKYMKAKIRYTSKGKITYYRGHGLRHPVNDYEQYYELAGRVKSASEYMGRDFSFGDQYIDDVADRSIRHGAPANWVLADMNHHLEYTAMQMIGLVNKVRAVEDQLELEELFETN
jgi:hypothetical protein